MKAPRVPPYVNVALHDKPRPAEEYARIAQRAWERVGAADVRVWASNGRVFSNLVNGMPPEKPAGHWAVKS